MVFRRNTQFLEEKLNIFGGNFEQQPKGQPGLPPLILMARSRAKSRKKFH
jgi:hypothetical protein